MKNLSSASGMARRTLLFTLSALLAFGSVFAAAPATAFAAAATPPTNAQLSLAYKHDQGWLQKQQTNLGKANGLVPAIQNLMTEAQSQSIDTTALSAALATFQAQLVTAGSSHTTAANVLAVHHGFDGNGSVIARTAALQTVHDATQSLKDAHGVLVQSMKDLLTAVQTFENTNQLFKQLDALQVAYLNEQAWLPVQQNNLNRAGVVVTNVQSLITVAQAHGLGTAALSSGLAVFQSQLATAQSAHTTAAGVLSTHAGFDASGNVTDVSAATATVQDARQSLLAAHTTLVQSTSDLLKVMTLWRIAKAITPASPVYPAFHTAYHSLEALHDAVTREDGPRFYALDVRLTNILNALLGELA